MRNTLLNICLALLCINGAFGQHNFERNILIDEGWRFFKGGAVGAEKQHFNDAAWRLIDLPHDWSIEDLPGKNTPFDKAAVGQQSTGFTNGGVGWYRKNLNIPAKFKGQRIFIRFDGIYCNAQVWLNGELVGKQPYGYTPFEIDLSAKLKFEEQNVLAIKVQNEGENTRWYTGSGIYRHVWLDVVDAVRVGRYGAFITTPKVQPNEAFVNVKTTIVNDGLQSASVKVITTIKNPGNEMVAKNDVALSINPKGNTVANADIKLSSPELWSIGTPSLYTAVTEVYTNGHLTDRVENKFGIRTISFDATSGFRLNGKMLKLKGGCVHHDNGPLGAKAYDHAEERRVALLKASGFNAIRCAHNPPSPAFLDACDRLGMLVIEEAFDMWETGKNPMDYHLFFKDWWQADLETMVYRDRNHPSIILWSIGNEIPDMDKQQVVDVAKKLTGFVRSLDTTRPVTAGVHQMKEDKDSFIGNLDVAGYNYAFEKYKTDHEWHPSRVMVATESSPFLAFDYWMGVVDNPWVIGDFVWTSFDYIGEASIGWRGFWPDENLYPWSLAYCGDLDICGWKRPQSFYRDVLWQDNQLSLFVKAPVPTFEINQKKEFWSQWNWYDVLADWNWPGNEGKPLGVNVYSSCDEVELFLNGKSLGKKPTNRSNQFTAIWNVPYKTGVLKAVGITGKRVIKVAELKTAAEPNQIQLSADRKQINANGQDLSYVTVELVDDNGVKNPKSDNLVAFEIQGPGEIVAVGNGNPTSLESYQQPQRKAWQGKCLVIVKAGKQAGTIKITAKSYNISTAEIQINVK